MPTQMTRIMPLFPLLALLILLGVPSPAQAQVQAAPVSQRFIKRYHSKRCQYVGTLFKM